MRQKIVNTLRGLGLVSLIDIIRFRYQSFKSSGKNTEFIKMHPNEAFPEPYMIYETFRMSYERYFNSGKETAMELWKEMQPYLDNKSAVKILDWGCGPARVVRHLPKILPQGSEIFGSDYNESYVKWCAAHIPGVIFKDNQLEPPLDFEAGFLDAVYALSIFTHLAEPTHHQWMEEVMRVLKPGGLFYFTTHGAITKENLLPFEKEAFDGEKLVVRANVKEGHRMFVAYHPEQFIRKLVAPYAEVLSFQPGTRQPWGLQQDAWLIRKKS
ncbi:class I SAM-dependent methyltransferase [Taibaiella lutea]|uniref:Class I SAM-dependent methyltransferase n=1 Tax=Taibaiella lutea TaxID=2608001 RepID=A0A5M6CEY5_9BACT|nr:class I SAM-dependent methyltransferase [Taibaiella lutea]KAA5533636.1 class I SAM-dependent methyltransferase [Taibaiella lutea]